MSGRSRKTIREFLIESNLPWEELAAIPETYATAWTCLFRNLEIAQGQNLVIRGATSSFGRAAINLAVNAGVRVIATTRNRERFADLEKLGADRVELEGPGLSQRIAEAKQLDAVLDLVGNSTILDSLGMLRWGGRVCLAGWLGGLDPIRDFNPLLQMASGVYLTFFGSFVFGTPGSPLSDVPLQTIAEQVEAGRFPGEAVARVPLRGDTPGASRDGGQRSPWQDGGGCRCLTRREVRSGVRFAHEHAVRISPGSRVPSGAWTIAPTNRGAVIIGQDPGRVGDTVETPAKED